MTKRCLRYGEWNWFLCTVLSFKIGASGLFGHRNALAQRKVYKDFFLKIIIMEFHLSATCRPILNQTFLRNMSIMGFGHCNAVALRKENTNL